MSVASEHVDKLLKIAEAMFNNLPTFTHPFTTAQLYKNRVGLMVPAAQELKIIILNRRISETSQIKGCGIYPRFYTGAYKC